MSNNLVTSLPISDRQFVQIEHVSRSLDLPVSEMPMKMVSQASNNPEFHHFPVSTEQMAFLEPVSCNPGYKNLTASNSTSGQSQYFGVSMGSNLNPILMPIQLGRRDAVITDNMTAEKTSLPVKRKAEGTLPNDSLPHNPLLPNKRPVNTGADASSFGFLQPSGTQKRTVQAQSKLGSPRLQTPPSLNKKMVRNDSNAGKSGSQRVPAAKKQTAQIESASKGQESSEAVRSKMRESLAAALALVCHKQNDLSKIEKVQNDSTNAQQVSVDSQVSEPNSIPGDAFSASGSEDRLPSKGSALVGKTNDCQVPPAQLPPNEGSVNGGQTFQEYQYSSMLPDEDVPFSDNFFVKDDLLQGNGLSWAFDFDAHMRAEKEAQNTEKPQSVKQEAQEQIEGSEVQILTPENLASKIEAELFKLFGGVNKKYKEKGRSLLFNLKDRNNPELRERVMSGEISPERLCAMSAEELASKELSEWRMAKAEEMAQMVVLPDTEVDIRRLVKKTHKGEYQVEVERDDDIAAEVSGGASMVSRPLPKKDTKTLSPVESPKDNENITGRETSSENQEFSGSLIIPTDGTDLMQGMMVDELKDAEFLPPIVSLDEFMESLNSEPPFENLSAHAGQKTPVRHEPSPKSGNNSGAADGPSESPKDASSKKADAVQKHEVDLTMKSAAVPAKQNVLPSTASKAEYIWEGNLQLHVSSSLSVGGLFQSGEKTSTREWPTSIEIKGRVRLDAFEKFLQELPMSRTRAVMVLQFDLKDKQSEKERSSFSEAIDSFTTDERLGYAEPTPGVELYICPPISRITEMLNKHMPKERPEAAANNSLEKALIGVVVWRRHHITNNRISPNSSSHHKHSSKKQHVSPTAWVQNSSNVNSNTPTRTPPPVLNKPEPQPEEDDEIPPGFGPVAVARAATKDDDDLPEFNFSGELKPSVPSRIPLKMTQTPVDQVRELIQKYGQSCNTTSSANNRSFVDNNRDLGLEPWDDDDDIPEWRPQPQVHLHHQPYLGAQGHRPPAHLLSPGMGPPMAPQQSPRGGLVPPPPGGRWVQPPGPPYGARWRQH